MSADGEPARAPETLAPRPLSIDPEEGEVYAEPMAEEHQGDRRANKRGQASKAQILDCAIALLGEHGYGGLSISAVCKAAGVAPTSIYWHFGDKAGLMAAIVKYSLRRDFDNFMMAFEKHRSTELLIDAYLRVFRGQIINDTPSCWAVIATLAEGRREAPEIAALVNEARRKQLDFARGWGELVAKAPDPDTFAHMIVGFNNFAATVWQHSRDEAEVDSVLRAMRELMLMLAEKMTRMVDEADFRACMASWGYEPGAIMRLGGDKG